MPRLPREQLLHPSSPLPLFPWQVLNDAAGRVENAIAGATVACFGLFGRRESLGSDLDGLRRRLARRRHAMKTGWKHTIMHRDRTKAAMTFFLNEDFLNLALKD